ncbi:hypothetical protein LZ31DRAFT_238176 [Colletotrichum somersetense]|nr:hypothetical protein LZ31DRAFT_238176 [Colletotrichum somersetense]
MASATGMGGHHRTSPVGPALETLTILRSCKPDLGPSFHSLLGLGHTVPVISPRAAASPDTEHLGPPPATHRSSPRLSTSEVPETSATFSLSSDHTKIDLETSHGASQHRTNVSSDEETFGLVCRRATDASSMPLETKPDALRLLHARDFTLE